MEICSNFFYNEVAFSFLILYVLTESLVFELPQSVPYLSVVNIFLASSLTFLPISSRHLTYHYLIHLSLPYSRYYLAMLLNIS